LGCFSFNPLKNFLIAMKKILLSALLFLGMTAIAAAQSLAYADVQYVLEKMPAHEQAQKQIDKIVEGWNKEIQDEYKKIDDMYKRFQAEQVLLTDNDRKRREEEIVNKEKATRELQKKYFGPSGDLLQKKQSLIKPVQDEIYAAIEKIASRKGLDLVIDKSSGVSLLFANPKYDITDDILKELGVK
jgi:outer membrane protein